MADNVGLPLGLTACGGSCSSHHRDPVDDGERQEMSTVRYRTNTKLQTRQDIKVMHKGDEN